MYLVPRAMCAELFCGGGLRGLGISSYLTRHSGDQATFER